MSSPFLILGKEEPNMIVIMKPMTEQKGNRQAGGKPDGAKG